MQNDILIALAILSCGCILGYGVADYYHTKEMLVISEEFKIAVKQARAKEDEWKKLNESMESEYQEKLSEMQLTHSASISELRKQLSKSTSRVPTTSNASSGINGKTRETILSEGVDRSVDIADRCSQEAAKLWLKLDMLQDAIKARGK